MASPQVTGKMMMSFPPECVKPLHFICYTFRNKDTLLCFFFVAAVGNIQLFKPLLCVFSWEHVHGVPGMSLWREL